MGEKSGLRKFMHRLSADERVLEAEDLRESVAELGATPTRACVARQKVCVAGTLRTVTLRPRAGVPALESELWDGHGTVNLVWLGRRRIPGVEPGRKVRARGRLSENEHRPTIFNPSYELLPPEG